MEIEEEKIEKLTNIINNMLFSITIITDIVEKLVEDVEQLKKEKNG